MRILLRGDTMQFLLLKCPKREITEVLNPSMVTIEGHIPSVMDPFPITIEGYIPQVLNPSPIAI